MKILDKRNDDRSQCCSILVSMSLKEYKDIAYDSFKKGGNIPGQRDIIKKSSAASKIRKRMSDDFINGALFPSVVIGLKISTDEINEIMANDTFEPQKYPGECLSIIDGMQRSGIYFNNYDKNESREIRVEFWISDNTVKLLYRMLVLNTGQIPWNTRRQIEVIFSNLSESIINSLFAKKPKYRENVEIMTIDDGKRRTQAGKYHKSTMIQLFLGYNTRRVKVDVNDQLADEYQRSDMMDSIEQDINFDLFVDAFSYLCELDFAFANCKDESDEGQFSEGRAIFGSVPSCLGFMVACAEYVMGKVPVERSDDEKIEKNNLLKNQIDKIAELLYANADTNFLALDSLNAVVSQLPKSRIGDEMRNLFKLIFTELLRYENLNEIPSMEAFWRS